MARKKSCTASASVASSSRRPPVAASDLSTDDHAQKLKNLNSILVAETAELRKQVKWLSTKLALTDSGCRLVDGIERGGVSLSTRLSSTAAVTTETLKAAEQEAAVETAAIPVTAEQKQSKPMVSELASMFADHGIERDVAAEQKQSKTFPSEIAPLSMDCIVHSIERESVFLSSNLAVTAALTTATPMAADQEACAETAVSPVNLVSAEQEQSEPISSELASTLADHGIVDSMERDGVILSCSPASTGAGCAANLPVAKEELATRMTSTLVKKAEYREEAGIEKMMEKTKAECTEEARIEKRMEEKLRSMEEKLQAQLSISIMAAEDKLGRLEEGTQSLTHEMISLKKRLKEMELVVNMARANKKSKWGILKWILPAGILVGVTCALSAKSK